MEEIWKDIINYEGKYEVSNLGRVRSLSYNGTGEIKFLKQSTNKRGYKRVGLCKDGKTKHYYVHRLVAMTFIPNPNNYKEVNHKDEKPSNNDVKNLEWCDTKYNNNYGTRGKKISKSLKGKTFNEEYRKKLSEGHKGKNKGKDNPNAKPILMYDREGNFIRRFDCISDTNEYFGKKNAYKNVSSCLRGERPTAYNHIFKYEDK